MPQGYENNGKPDAAWWLEQVKAAEEFRKKRAYEALWDTWRSYYRGNWKSNVLPVNLFFSFLRATIPRVYFRNPAVSVSPGMPGFLEMAFSQVTNRIDNKLIRQMALKGELKLIIQDAWLFGTGVGKLGFGSVYTPPAQSGDADVSADKKGDLVEYDPRTNSNMPWFRRVPTGQFLVPDGTMSYRDARWVGHQIERPLEDIKADERLDKKMRELVQPTRKEGEFGSTMAAEVAQLIEIRDAKTRQVMVIAPNVESNETDGRILFSGPDIFQEAELGFNLFPVIFNPDDEFFWGNPDAKILEPHQLEMNEINTQMMKHRRLSLVKLLYRQGRISEAQLTKMLSEDVAAGVAVDGDPATAVNVMQVANIPTDLIVAKRESMQDVRETMGFSRNQLGEFQSKRGDTTATESAIVQQNSEVRVDERRDITADVVTEMVGMMNEVLFTRWTGEQVQEVVGPGGARVWVRFSPRDLRMGHYSVRVDPDSARPRTRQSREERAFAIYTQLKANPLIDPEKLTRFLLTELEGVQMDDLMVALPAVNEGATQNPLSLPQFAGMLRNQTQQAQRGRRSAGPRTPALLRG